MSVFLIQKDGFLAGSASMRHTAKSLLSTQILPAIEKLARNFGLQPRPCRSNCPKRPGARAR